MPHSRSCRLQDLYSEIVWTTLETGREFALGNFTSFKSSSLYCGRVCTGALERIATTFVSASFQPVCTENLNTGVAVMKSAQQLTEAQKKLGAAISAAQEMAKTPARKPVTVARKEVLTAGGFIRTFREGLVNGMDGGRTSGRC